jgi:DNA-binding NtrC family response regulator
MKTGFANLVGKDGIVASVSFDQSLRGALYQFERAYMRYHTRAGTMANAAKAVGLERTYFYQRCRQLGVPVQGR